MQTRSTVREAMDAGTQRVFDVVCCIVTDCDYSQFTREFTVTDQALSCLRPIPLESQPLFIFYNVFLHNLELSPSVLWHLTAR
jgi:hypothetical protein